MKSNLNFWKQAFTKYWEVANKVGDTLYSFNYFLLLNDCLPSEFKELEQNIELGKISQIEKYKALYDYLCCCREKIVVLMNEKAINMGKQINDKILFRELDKQENDMNPNKSKVSLVIESIKHETNTEY